MKIEFLYDKKKDITSIYIWKSMSLIEIRTMPNDLTEYQKKKITKEITNESNKR